MSDEPWALEAEPGILATSPPGGLVLAPSDERGTEVSDELDLGIHIPEPPPKREKNGVSWVAYRPQKPVHCDACVAEVHAKWPNGTHAPNRATYRRKEKGVDTYWCSIHAEPKKAADNQGKKR